VIRHALDESSLKDAASQWQTILPILVEAETSDPAEPKPLFYTARPRRLLYPRQGVNIRRERTRDGWCLHITGHDATGMFMDGVLDEIERWCGPA
jgi:ParB family chromosome partitioning protein